MIKLLCIAGKAGAGKDTIARDLVTSNPNRFSFVTSFTSRPMREREVEGKDYFFVSKDEFINKIDSGEMLEWSFFNDWYYGTTEQSFDKEKINVCVCNPDGVRSFTKLGFDMTVVYVYADDKTRLLRQLNREKDPDVAEICRRYQADEANFKDLKYDVLVTNTNRSWSMATQDIVCWLLQKGKI